MEGPTFLIKNGSVDFENKQKNLFDILDMAEKEKNMRNTPSEEFMEIDKEKSKKRKRKETKQFRGKESLFKEPVDLPLRFRKGYKMPDFQRNPHKWVKYSLGDITQDDMSNESNTAAALSFLREIRNQKKKTSIKMEVVDEPEHKSLNLNFHQFNRPIKEERIVSCEPIIDTERDSSKPVFKSSKLIMPEYVVGLVKKENKTARKKIVGEKGKEIYLNHIHEYEDE